MKCLLLINLTHPILATADSHFPFMDITNIDALAQWFPNHAQQHTGAPRDVIRCAAKNIEIKFNQVEFIKFHAADFCQHGTLSILVVIPYVAQCYDHQAIAYVATSLVPLQCESCFKEKSSLLKWLHVF